MKYCRQCGSQLADEAKFCASCGTAVIEPAQPEKVEVKAVEKQVMVEAKIEDTTQVEMFQQPETVYQQESFQQTQMWKEPARPRVPFLANPIFLGILFIVSGLCMLLLPTMPVMDLTEAAMYGDTYVASVTVANNVISGFESFAFQAPALIAIVTGIVLMQKRRGAFKLAMLGGIFQLLAAAGSLLIMVVVLAFAPTLVELYIWDPEVISIGTQLLRGQGMNRFMIVELPIMLLGVASFVFTLIARGKERKTGSQVALDLFDKMPRSAVSLIVLIPFITLLFMLEGFLGALWTGRVAAYALSGFSMANVVIANYTIPVIFLVAIAIIYCMLGYKWKKGLMILPGMGTFLLYGIVVTLITLAFGREMLISMYTPEDIIDIAQSSLTPHILAHALMALALFFWIAASARGGIPAWLQAVLGVVIVILYIVLELLFTIGLGGFPQMGGAFPLAQYVIYLIILGFSIPMALACKPKKG